MSTLTKGTVVSAVVKDELPLNGSRREMLVDESQTLVVGTVVRDGAGGRKVALTDQTNEVQRVVLAGLAAGVVRLGITHPITGEVSWTDELEDDFAVATINTELDTLTAAVGDIVTTGTTIDDFTITYTGGLWSGVPVPLIQVKMGDLATATAHAIITRTTKGGGAAGAAANEVQDFVFDATAGSGKYIMSIKDHSGVATVITEIEYDGSDLQAKLDAALGTDRVVLSSEDADGGTLTWSGAGMAGVDQDPITIDVSGLATTTAVTITETAKGRPGGTQEANAICIDATTTAGGALTTKAVFIVGKAVVDVDELAFGAGDKQNAIESLERRGIRCATAAEYATQSS